MAQAYSPEDRPVASLARSASVLSLGNVVSRVLGLLRETVIANYFGASGAVSAFRLAARVPTMIYDLLVGGMLSAALVPILSDYARPARRYELWQAASVVLSFVSVILAALVLLIELLARPLAFVLGSGLSPELQLVTARALRIMGPTVLVFGCAGLLTALLYALNRFTFPAIAAAVFNLGIVVAAPLLAGSLGIDSLAVGILAGSLVQLFIQLPGLRDSRLGFVWNTRHPALRRMGRLYLPVALGLVVGQLQVIVDGNLATRTGEHSVAWMQTATTLREFPLGLVSVAVSLAALPTLSRLAADGDLDGYRRTLARGLRLVIVVTLPAAFGLFVLARPLVQLIFEHGQFTSHDTLWTTRALWGYIPGLIFAAVDWPLNYAYYARQDTRTPTLVGIVAAGVYLVAALALLGRLGMLGLVLADSAKHGFHASAMLWLLRRDVGNLGGQKVVSTSLKALLAAGVMGAFAWLLVYRLGGWLSTGVGWREFALVLLVGGTGAAIYVGLLAALRIEELGVLWRFVSRRTR